MSVLIDIPVESLPRNRYHVQVDSAQQIKMQKEAAALAAAELLQDGMLVGLGSGSTAELTLAAVGRRVQDGLKITGIATSEKTARLASMLNIPLATLEDFAKLDIAFDGAGEIEIGSLHLIKGGGGGN